MQLCTYIHSFIHICIHTHIHLYVCTSSKQLTSFVTGVKVLCLFLYSIHKYLNGTSCYQPPVHPVLFICCFLLALCSLYSFKHFQIIWYIIHTNANAFTTTSPLSPSRPHRYLRTSFIKECVCPSPILTKLTHKHTHIHTYTYMLIKFFMYYQQTCVCSMPTFVHMY